MEKPAERPRRPGLFKALAVMLASRRTSGVLLARMATMMVMVPTMAFLPLLMDQWLKASGMQIGLVIACRTLVNALLQTPFGRMADRGDKIAQLKGGCLIISLVMCLVPLVANFPSLLLLFIILGIGEAMIWPVLGALAAADGRIHGHGTMMGVFSLAMSSGVLLGSLGAGVIMDLAGLGWSFLVIGITVFAMTMTAAAMIRTGSGTATGA
jgi:MFS family permease